MTYNVFGGKLNLAQSKVINRLWEFHQIYNLDEVRDKNEILDLMSKG